MPLFYFYRSVYSCIWLSNWVVNCERNSWLCRWVWVGFRELVFLCQCDGSISCCTHFEWALCFSFMATLSRSVTFLFKLCPFLACFMKSRVGYFLDATLSLTLHDSMGCVSQTPVNTYNRHFSVSWVTNCNTLSSTSLYWHWLPARCLWLYILAMKA